VAVVVAVFASITGLRHRVAPGWAVGGLALGLAFGVLLALDDPAATGAVVILATAVAFTVTQWR
jgi:hypothetical protein